jgi:plasmid maintenance system antidote protein VapI
MSTVTTKPQYSGDLIREDAAAKGWLAKDLALAAHVADMTVYRFLSGERQSPRIAQKLADALGHPLERYLIRKVQAA